MQWRIPRSAKHKRFGASQAALAAAIFRLILACSPKPHILSEPASITRRAPTPKEPIAAAGCLTMALAFHLQAAGYTPAELSNGAAVTLDPEGQSFRITRSALTLRVQCAEPGRNNIRADGRRRWEELPGPKASQRREITLDAKLV
jgi:lipoyl-dependent peroxiredoxin